ncbi:MAG: dTMP kinase [Gemmatimonadota bacterium]
MKPLVGTGRLVTFEGGEGSGKSTQVALLASWLGSRGVRVVTARDPGRTGVGEAIRHVLLDPASGPMAAETELLLYLAARAQLVRELVEPALAAGAVVLLDRFDDSSFAYQGGGRGIPEGLLAPANELATGGLRADLTVLIDLASDEGRRRRGSDASRGAEDRIEREEAGFHERVRDAYRRRAAAEPARFLVVDGRESTDIVHDRVRRRVLALLEPGPWGGTP